MNFCAIMSSLRIPAAAAILALALCSSAASWAQTREFRVREFGAQGDGKTLDTPAIQAAIDAAAAAGGGTVVLSPGTYLSGSIFVKSHTTLEVQSGATILGSQRLADYPLMQTRVAGIEMVWPAALVNVSEQQDVRIVGAGTIDGDGKIWWDGYWVLRKQYEPKGMRWAADYDARRPRLIQIYKSTRVELSGPLLTRSGFWTVHICYSDTVHVDNVTIRNNVGGRGPSTDGIDVDSSRNVLVERADISVNDDALCLKAGRDSDGLRVNRPDENIVIRNSIVRDGAAAITIGSETSGGFRNVEVYGIHAFGHVSSGVLIKSAYTRGGWAEAIRIHDLQLEDVPIPIHVTMNWYPTYSYAYLPPDHGEVPDFYKVLATPVPLEKGLAHFRDLSITNLTATGATTAFDIKAESQAPLTGFVLDNIQIQAKSAGKISGVKDWTLTHVTVHAADGSQVAFSDASGTKLSDDSGIALPAQPGAQPGGGATQ
ncbi:MAG: glycosyl hydrolase family 28 protein [Terracidiphilus sp.]